MFESKKSLGKLMLLSPNHIQPSPYQARCVFEESEIVGLAQSIQQNGLLQPITVRRIPNTGKYELIAGERRLRACKIVGMAKIPAILCEYEDEQTASLSLLENLQRQDLNPFEQARGMKAVIALWGCTQLDAAHRLGMAQPTLANKLRLLQLSDELQTFVVEHKLNERHARAVLRLPDQQRADALAEMAKQEMTARIADAYVEQLLHPILALPESTETVLVEPVWAVVESQTVQEIQETQTDVTDITEMQGVSEQQDKPTARKKQKKSRLRMVGDVRLFVNTVNHAIQVMIENGIPATSEKTEGEGYIEYTVRIPTTL